MTILVNRIAQAPDADPRSLSGNYHEKLLEGSILGKDIGEVLGKLLRGNVFRVHPFCAGPQSKQYEGHNAAAIGEFIVDLLR